MPFLFYLRANLAIAPLHNDFLQNHPDSDQCTEADQSALGAINRPLLMQINLLICISRARPGLSHQSRQQEVIKKADEDEIS